MREFLTYFEISKEQMKVPEDKPIFTNVSSSAYYGYQPTIHFVNGLKCGPESLNGPTYMDTSFSYGENEPPRLPNRKRAAENSYSFMSKKRRENDAESTIGNISKNLHLRRPTHNIPDLSMCMVGYCIS